MESAAIQVKSLTLFARILGGKAFSLESFRGKLDPLKFWIDWSKVEQLAELKNLNADLHGNFRVPSWEQCLHADFGPITCLGAFGRVGQTVLYPAESPADARSFKGLPQWLHED